MKNYNQKKKKKDDPLFSKILDRSEKGKKTSFYFRPKFELPLHWLIVIPRISAPFLYNERRWKIRGFFPWTSVSWKHNQGDNIEQ